MLHRSFFVLTVCFALVLSACSSGSDDKKPLSGELDPNASLFGGVCDNSGTDGSSQLNINGIVNGYKLGQNNPIANRVVALLFIEGNEMDICTGSLLPGNIVLTAAHCIPSTSKTSDIKVVFNNDLNCLTKNNKAQFMRDVSAMRKNINYSGAKDTDNDIAMLKFEGPLPAGYETFDVPDRAVDVVATDKLIMSGYGETNYGAEDSKILRVTSLSGEQMSREVAKPQSFTVNQAQTGICSGDSGGPMMVYKYGRLQIIGVASAGSNSHATRNSELCNDKSHYVDVSKQLDWIRTSYNILR